MKTIKTIKSMIAVVLLVAGTCMLTGCNTVKGIGNDIYSAGETTQSWINDSQADGGY